MTNVAALFYINPTAQFTMLNDDLSTLVWNDPSPAPTPDQVKAFIAAHEYRELRRAEYPLVTDQLDAVMKGGQSLVDMQAACLAVKAKYPKGA